MWLQGQGGVGDGNKKGGPTKTASWGLHRLCALRPCYRDPTLVLWTQGLGGVGLGGTLGVVGTGVPSRQGRRFVSEPGL